MQLHSLGLRTELIFHRYEGEVVDRGEYLLIRTPSNPNYHWGNMLIFPGPPGGGDFDRWEELFVREHGDAAHRVFGWDREPEGERHAVQAEGPGAPPVGEITPFLEAGFRVERTVVLTTSSVQDPPRVNEAVEVRPLAGDAEWTAALELGVLCRDERYLEEGYRNFLTPKMALYRRMQEDGRGSWFGAFLDGQMVADLGLFTEDGLARFQSVKTHPSYRRRGICGTAVATVARFGLEAMGAEKLVIMADVEYHAVHIYESVGFERVEQVAGVVRP